MSEYIVSIYISDNTDNFLLCFWKEKSSKKFLDEFYVNIIVIKCWGIMFFILSEMFHLMLRWCVKLNLLICEEWPTKGIHNGEMIMKGIHDSEMPMKGINASEMSCSAQKPVGVAFTQSRTDTWLLKRIQKAYIFIYFST